MPKKRSSSRFKVAKELEGHLTVFLETLVKAGYSEKTYNDKKRLIMPFIRWLGEDGIAMRDVNEALMDEFLACPSRRRYNHHTALQQFIEHLRLAGAVPNRSTAPSPADDLFREYIDYLREKQGLSQHSINAYSPFVRDFIVAQRLPEDATALDALAVRHHLLEHSRGRSLSCARLLAASLRSFLRFCFLDGMTTTNFSTAVISVRRWQPTSIPVFLIPEEIEEVIVAAADRSTTDRCRDYAILLLLARLGLRASEVITLELEDIHWETGEIIVRGKGRLHDRLPLLADVGEAIAQYLSTARGQSRSRRVFLRHIAPHVGLSQPSIVSKIAREALQRVDLLPTGRVGAHIFRYSLATSMLQRGASLVEISQVLRHRSTTTTEIYAKVDFEALRGVALPWPSTEVSQ